MSQADDFSRSLLEEAKRFLEKGREATEPTGVSAYLHAAVMLAFCAFEAHVNAVSDDFLTRSELTILERSILGEKDYKLDKGEFVLADKLKMYRLEERFEFLHKRFSGKDLDKTASWWTRLKGAINHRNELVHPKQPVNTTVEIAQSALESIIDAIDVLFRAVYCRAFPAKGRGLGSTLSF